MISALKRAIRHMLSPPALGVLDYYRSLDRGGAWGGPFNGQNSRQALFRELIHSVAPAAIVETGTYQGNTTELFADTGLPVFTIEGEPRNYSSALVRLRRRRNVTLLNGDSRTELAMLLDGPLEPLRRSNLFFYLDAHWGEDLPLAEELEIAFSRCPAAVVMIDDFEVPGDPDYGFDDYGPGKVLNADYIDSIRRAHELGLFYPSTPSSDESGVRRGCAVLCGEDVHCARLQSIRLLRRG